MKQNQYGRTMVEMLCVLGIIGVLTVAGIKAYNYALIRYRINKTISLVSHIINETRIAHSQQENYDNLDNCTAATLGVFSSDVVVGSGINHCNDDNYNDVEAYVPYGGKLHITTSGKDDNFNNGDVGAAIIEIEGISHEACMGLAVANWLDGSTGRGTTSGIIAVATSHYGSNTSKPDTGDFISYAGKKIDDVTLYTNCNYNNHNSSALVNIACATGVNEENRLPMKPAYAIAGCNCGDALTCAFAVKFY